MKCRGKQCYSKREAETIRNARLRPHRRIRRHIPDFLRIYHCPHCNHWHLTSKPDYHDPASR